MQDLKGKFLIKGKRLNKLEAAFNNNNTVEEDTVSEEDEAADCKENGQKAKSKVCQVLNNVCVCIRDAQACNRCIFGIVVSFKCHLDPSPRLLSEIKNQTCQTALRHGRLLQECPF